MYAVLSCVKRLFVSGLCLPAVHVCVCVRVCDGVMEAAGCV
jgi:hypothetical protein